MHGQQNCGSALSSVRNDAGERPRAYSILYGIDGSGS